MDIVQQTCRYLTRHANFMLMTCEQRASSFDLLNEIIYLMPYYILNSSPSILGEGKSEDSLNESFLDLKLLGSLMQ